MDLLKQREDRIKLLIERGITCNIETGEVFNRLGKIIEYKDTAGYRVIGSSLNGKRFDIRQHQFIYYISTSKVVYNIDHINRVKDDNRIINLREVTHQQNTFNRKFKGYSFRKDRGTWRVRIMVDGKSINIGSYKTEEDASKAYSEARNKYHII